MIEVPKNKSKSAVLEIVVVSGLFMSAFYFLFFDKINKKVYDLYKDTFNPETYSDKPRQQSDPSLLEGRKEYCSQSNPNRCLRGFDLPNNINDLKFIDGRIRVSVLPDSNVFSGLPPFSLVYLSRQGDKLIYEGRINGIYGIYSENYNDVRDKLILPNNSYLLT